MPPQARVSVRIRADGEAAEILRCGSELITTMAALSSLEIAAAAQRAPDAATAVVGTVEIHVAGVIDPVKERARLTKQREQLRKRIHGAQRKLQNENFLHKASPDVVQKERQRLLESEAEMDNVEAALAALQ